MKYTSLNKTISRIIKTDTKPIFIKIIFNAWALNANEYNFFEIK